ncbi:hypothetical protein WN55_05898 [Dufourea novaeangliae]|uniref:Uncharacterized protein n=1 Tax=Dufourea novaeangliae TaxID=178035 RepID=A0A154P0A5_DUFNO|nr:hypothetical protein WN55_05898 [Dufourea novaeangliae]
MAGAIAFMKEIYNDSFKWTPPQVSPGNASEDVAGSLATGNNSGTDLNLEPSMGVVRELQHEIVILKNRIHELETRCAARVETQTRGWQREIKAKIERSFQDRSRRDTEARKEMHEFASDVNPPPKEVEEPANVFPTRKAFSLELSTAITIMAKTSEVGVQAYASWAMVSRPTQTGLDISYHDPPPHQLRTITPRPWKGVRHGRYRGGTGTQTATLRRDARTQTPREGIPVASDRPGRKRKGQQTEPSAKRRGVPYVLTPQRSDAPMPTPRDELKDAPSPAGENNEEDLSWKVLTDPEDDPTLEISRLNPQDPLGLLQLTEEMIDSILLSPVE